MTTMNRDAGRMAATRSYAEKLVTVAPNDRRLQICSGKLSASPNQSHPETIEEVKRILIDHVGKR
jgi:hypothetical protein